MFSGLQPKDEVL